MTGEPGSGQEGGADRFSSAATRGVETLLGDPKRAIIKLSVPMIIAMSLQTIYNVVDALWVSGLGPDALAAVGLFFPFFFIIIAIATGIGVGAAAALSRRIGARDKDGADNVAIHSLLMMMGASVVMAIYFVPASRSIFATMGAGTVLDETVVYSQILFAAAPLLFFINWATAILRGEGDVKRAMYATALGLVVNIGLDPIFIYTLGLGVAGAAWASMVGMGISVVPLVHWMFIKRDTFVTMRRCCFTYSRDIIKDILKVGFPATVMQMAMSISILVLNLFVLNLGGTDGIAVFTTGWRVIMIAILPLLGIATAVVSVAGAAYGAKEYGKIEVALGYAIRLGFALEVVVAIVTFLLAPQISAAFSTGQGGDRIEGDITVFLQILVLHYPFVAFGMFSSSMFQGTGKGNYALVVTLVRTVILTTFFSYFLAYPMGMDLSGVWWGINIGNIAGAVLAYLWARAYITHLNGEEHIGEPAVVAG